MVFSGVLIGWMVSLGEYSIVILLLLGLYEISKRESDKTSRISTQTWSMGCGRPCSAMELEEKMIIGSLN